MPSVFLQRLPHRVFRAVRVKESHQIAVQRAHFIHRVHGVVGRADFPQAGGAHELEKAQTGFAIRGAFKILGLPAESRPAALELITYISFPRLN